LSWSQIGFATGRPTPDKRRYRTSAPLATQRGLVPLIGANIHCMSRKWCCQEFESHASIEPVGDGFHAMLVWAKWGFQSFLMFYTSGKQPPDNAEGGVRISFCPWCGMNLKKNYAPKS
jgi:hypothetical protein